MSDELTEPGAAAHDDDAIIGLTARDAVDYVDLDVPEGVNGSDFAAALLEATGGEDKHYLVESTGGGFRVPLDVYEKAHLPSASDYTDADTYDAQLDAGEPGAAKHDGAAVLGSETGTTAATDEPVKLAGLKLDELKAQAAAEGVEIGDAKTKAEVTGLIEQHRSK